MEIYLNDYEEILKFLVKERWEGNEFVSYPDTVGPVNKDDLVTFKSIYEAKEYCFQMSTSFEQYNWLAIRSAYRCMSEAKINQCLLIEKEGVVDILGMINHYYKNRLEHNSNQNLTTSNTKPEIMNEKNFEYLYNQIYYGGMNDITREQLKEQIISGKDEFQLSLDKKFGNDSARAVLNFKKSDQNAEMYFYNSYDLILKKAGREEALQHNFRVSYGNSFTMKEAYNMLDGRSVNKDFIKVDKDDKANNQEYNAWAYIDFKNTDDQGRFMIAKQFNFELEKVIGEYPIKNMEYPQNRQQLLDSLKKGNLHYVTMETSRGDEKIYLEANPRYNSIKLYDDQLRPIKASMKKQGEAQGKQEEQSTTQGKEHNQAEGESKSNKKDQKNAPQNPAATNKKTTAKKRSRGVA